MFEKVESYRGFGIGHLCDYVCVRVKIVAMTRIFSSTAELGVCLFLAEVGVVNATFIYVYLFEYKKKQCLLPTPTDVRPTMSIRTLKFGSTISVTILIYIKTNKTVICLVCVYHISCYRRKANDF